MNGEESIGSVLVRRIARGDAIEFLVRGEPIMRLKMEPKGQDCVAYLEMVDAIVVRNLPKKKPATDPGEHR